MNIELPKQKWNADKPPERHPGYCVVVDGDIVSEPYTYYATAKQRAGLQSSAIVVDVATAKRKYNIAKFVEQYY